MTAGRKPGSVKTGGRKRGSLDRGQRMVISEAIAGDILKTYKRLGPDWLLKVAQERPDLFLSQCLSKLMPPAFKENDGDGNTFNQQINFASDPIAVAQRVAFALNLGIHYAQERELAPVAERVPGAEPQHARTPQEALNDWQPSPPQPEPAEDLDRQRWAEELPMTPEERRNAALVRETQEVNISSYRGGSPAEQGGYYQPPEVQTKASAGELCRKLSRRGRDLL